MPIPEQNFESRRGDDLDRSIDTALAKYAAVEPRAGLENRILANLRTEQIREIPTSWWRWGIATALTAVVLVSMALIWRSARHSEAEQGPANAQVLSQPRKKSAGDDVVATVRQTRRPIGRMPTPKKIPAVTAKPKLDQFPSPQSLSTDEIALARYVKNFPKEAQLIAQRQEEFELETQKIMNHAGSEIRPMGSIQEER